MQYAKALLRTLAVVIACALLACGDDDSAPVDAMPMGDVELDATPDVGEDVGMVDAETDASEDTSAPAPDPVVCLPDEDRRTGFIGGQRFRQPEQTTNCDGTPYLGTCDDHAIFLISDEERRPGIVPDFSDIDGLPVRVIWVRTLATPATWVCRDGDLQVNEATSWARDALEQRPAPSAWRVHMGGLITRGVSDYRDLENARRSVSD